MDYPEISSLEQYTFIILEFPYMHQEYGQSVDGSSNL